MQSRSLPVNVSRDPQPGRGWFSRNAGWLPVVFRLLAGACPAFPPCAFAEPLPELAAGNTSAVPLLQWLIVALVVLLVGLAATSWFLGRRLKEQIAQLKTARKELLDHSARLRLGTEKNHAGIWEYHPAIQAIHLSPQWYTMLGYEPAGREKELPLATFQQFVDPGQRESVDRSFTEYISNGGKGQLEVELRLQRADGTWCWVLSKSRAVEWDGHGRPTRIIGLDVNIESLKDAHERMLQSEAKFRAVFENAPYAIVINSLEDGSFLDANRAFLDRRGIGKEELPELKSGDFLPDSEREWADIRDLLMKTGSVMNREVTVTRKDGSRGCINYSSVLLDIEGRKQVLSMTIDVTETKKAENALKESREHFRSLFMNAPVSLAHISLDGKTIEINDRFVRLFGYTIEEVPDVDHWWGLAYPDPDFRSRVIAEWRAAVARALADGSAIGPGEYPVTCKDGTMRKTIIGANLMGASMVVSFFDITGTRERQAALEERMALLRATFDATNDGILVVNKDLKVTQVNPQFYELWHIPPELQKTDEDVELREFVQDQLADPASFRNMVEMLYHSRIRDMYEIPFKDGRVFECYSAPVEMAEREVGRVWEFRDISERKRAEAAVRESEARFRTLFKRAPIPMAHVSLDGRILDLNDRFVEMVGYTLEEMPTVEQAWQLVYPDPVVRQDVTTRWRKGVERAIAGNGEIESLETPVRCKDGTVRAVIVNTRLIGENIIVSYFDLTDRKQAEAEREKLRDQLLQSQKLEAVGVLAGGVAHDFNNMLLAIMGYAELALHKAGATDPIRKNLDSILDATRRSADLTRQLLAFARKQTIEPIVFDLNAAVESILKMARRIIGENIELIWRPGEGPCTVRMDPSQFDQILINLCVNARDAIREVGRILIETGTTFLDADCGATHAEFAPGDYVFLAISDNGRGMDKQTQAHIFEPFFTTKGPGRGSGMGLATVYGIVKQNQGGINVYSELGKGTTFRIYLPLSVAEEALASPEWTEEIPQGRGETLLIVEDDPMLLEMTTMMLRMLGYATLSAGTPGEAMRTVEASGSEIHLVLTDVVMPEMTGRDLAERLCAVRPKMKVLYMSGYTANVIADQGVLDRGIHFIQKPFSMHDIAVKIRTVLD